MNLKIIEETVELIDSVILKSKSAKRIINSSNGQDAEMTAKMIETYSDEINGIFFQIKHKRKYLAALAKFGLSHEDLVKKGSTTIIYRVVDCNSGGCIILMPVNRKGKKVVVSNPKTLTKINGC